MKKALLVLALACTSLGSAPAADAIRRCDLYSIECHKACTLPQTDRGIKNIYWNYC